MKVSSRCQLVARKEMVNSEGGVVLAKLSIKRSEMGSQVSVGNVSVADF